MQMLTISTANLVKSREANIDGHVYAVRKLGAGEQLDISQISAELGKIRQDALNLQAKIQKSESDAQREKYETKLYEISASAVKLSQKIESIYTKAFDDHGDQSKSKELVHKIGIENAIAIINQVFEASDD